MSYTCGTGGWSGPLPGDPSTNSILTATPVFGGIDITWTPAIVNPHAVAHTYLYRSTNPDFLTAVRIATVGGTHFYDKLENLLTYYYWIQIVSINGTLGEVIGPASAIPRLSIDATIQALTGRIDNGVLAQSLKSEIDRISLIDGDLFQEIQDRIAANELLGAAIQTAQTDASQAVSLLNEEITQRTTAYNVLLQTINTMAGQVNDNKAAIETESTLRISNDEALAQQITNVQSAAGDNLAAVQTTLQTNINTVNGKVTDIGALYTAKVQVNGLIGGFGVYNDGTEVQAGFDVDTFWVGRTGPDKKKPFIIDSVSGETYIDKAVIPTLTADMIDTKGLSIKDMDGNVILSAGTALDWSRIGGSKPSDEDILNTGPNICPNPDLMGDLSTNSTAPGWTLSSTGTPLTPLRYITTDSVAPPWNRQQPVFYARCDDTDDAVIWRSAQFDIAEGVDYCLSCWAQKYGSGTPRVYLRLRCYAADGTTILGYPYVLSAFTDLTSTWAQYHGVIGPSGQAIPAGTRKAQIEWFGGYLQVGSSMATRFGLNEGKVPNRALLPPDLLGQHNPITSSNVTTYIDNAAIGNAQIANASITNAKIANATILAANIADGNITNAKIANAAITNAKIGNAAVDTLQIAGNAVTIPVSAQGTSSCQTAATDFGGAPVALVVCATGKDTHSSTGSTTLTVTMTVRRNSTTSGVIKTITVATKPVGDGTDITQVLDGTGAWVIRDTPGAGSHYYHVSITGGTNCSILAIGVQR
jgi:hypothetical protein